jgi:hypothetical protein
MKMISNDQLSFGRTNRSSAFVRSAHCFCPGHRPGRRGGREERESALPNALYLPVTGQTRVSAHTEVIVKILFAMAATGTLMLCGAGASATELPSFELTGFPISPHQFSVVGSANVKEQPPSSSLTMAGMPASPHQVAVLTPRASKEQAATNPFVAASFSNR